jgi:hypothetical protein
MQLTDIQRGMMRHALGLDRSKNAYRNHYEIGSAESATAWWDLCSRGLAVLPSPAMARVTRAGFAEVALPGETFDAETFIGTRTATTNRTEVR